MRVSVGLFLWLAGQILPCSGFVPSTIGFFQNVHRGICESADSGVDVLVQSRRTPREYQRQIQRRKTMLSQDPDSKYRADVEITLDQELEIDTIKPSRKEDYRVIIKSEQELLKQKKKKKRSNKGPSSDTVTMLWQPALQLQVEQLKRRIQTSINDPLVECAVAGLILLSSILVAVTTIPALPAKVLGPMEVAEDIVAYLFLAEFLTRWLSCTEKRGRFVTQPLVLVDVVVVVLPLLLPLLDTASFPSTFAQSGLINLRLLRVLRLQRVLRDEETFSKFVSALRFKPGRSSITLQHWELQLARVLLSVFTLLSVAAGLIYTTENAVNPNIDDYFTALYFTLTTLTTVGFGDIIPMTWQGKLVVSGSILAGITIIPAQAATLVEALLQRDRELQRQQQSWILESPMLQASSQPASSADVATLQVAQKCPTCGVGLHWSHATYCYNCASPLQSSESKTLVLPD